MSATAATTTPTLLALLPASPSHTFMSLLPDSQTLSSMCIPGTHETFARYGWPVSQCQEKTSTITKQLEDGIRFMDLRVRPDGPPGEEKLWAFHGSRPQKIELGDALSQVYAFLDGIGSRETLILSIKAEHGDAAQMQKLLFDLYITSSVSHRWWLEPNWPANLGQCRGKIVLFSRFGHGDSQPGGVHPPIWPDNHEGTFSYTLPSGSLINTQDWYNIGSWRSIPRKWELAVQLLQESGNRPDVFALNFISCASFPLATPPMTAKGSFAMRVKGMNVRLLDHVVDVLGQQAEQRARDEGGDKTAPAAAAVAAAATAIAGLQACFAIDFYDYDGAAALIPLLIQANFAN